MTTEFGAAGLAGAVFFINMPGADGASGERRKP